MAKTVGNRTKAGSGRSQDDFDRAFIMIINELQTRGFCKNILKVEQFLKIPYNTLYQVLNGSRGIPLTHRDNILQFLTGRYDINPLFFGNTKVGMYKHDPPLLEDVQEEYLVAKKTNWLTSGDMKEVERLRLENQSLKQTLKDKEAMIKAMNSELVSLRRLVDVLDRKKR